MNRKEYENKMDEDRLEVILSVLNAVQKTASTSKICRETGLSKYQVNHARKIVPRIVNLHFLRKYQNRNQEAQ